jgi:hypothetical protein
VRYVGELGSEPRPVTEIGALICRLGESEGIPNAALYLASDEAASVTGSNLRRRRWIRWPPPGTGPARDEDRAVMCPILAKMSKVDDQRTNPARPQLVLSGGDAKTDE